MVDPAPTGEQGETPPLVIKKYANRRLYNTETSSYVTLDALADMLRRGRDFVVVDAKTGEDITRSVLTQIIVEQESKGDALLPTTFLRQLVSLYGGGLERFLPRYLEQAMASFAEQQRQMRRAMEQTVGTFFPGFEEMSRQNAQMMERAMNFFSPFARRSGETVRSEGGAGAGSGQRTENPAPDPRDLEIAALRAEVERLRAALEERRDETKTGGGEGKNTP
jgi:polyhydroxyalkanoate synthesis repressor PhaR